MSYLVSTRSPSTPDGFHTKQQVFHYWQIFKNSSQYLKMMESQLFERQRERRLEGAIRRWSTCVAEAQRAARHRQQAAADAQVEEASPPLQTHARGYSEPQDRDMYISQEPRRRKSPSHRRQSTGMASGLARRGTYRHGSPDRNFLMAGAAVSAQSGTYRQLVTALMYWKRFTRHHSWRRLRLDASLRFSKWIRMAACFKCIRSYAARRAQTRARRLRVVSRLRLRKAAGAFTAWVDAVDEKHTQDAFHHECMRRILNTCRNRALTAAFEAWVYIVDSVTRATTVALSSFQRATKRAFGQWADVARRENMLHNALTLVVLRRAHRLLAKTFSSMALQSVQYLLSSSRGSSSSINQLG